MNKSYLMVAGDKQKHLDKLDKLLCDIAIVNLEDGVFDKNYARELVYNNLLKRDNSDIVVRINSLDSCGKEDIKLINKIKPKAIRVPKIKTLDDIKIALDLICDDIEVHLSIETKEIFNILTQVKLDPRVSAVYLGILDLLVSLDLPQSILNISNSTIDYILTKFLVDSKIAGVEAISFVYQEYQNLEQFAKWCQKEKDLGFKAKACISLPQVDIVNKIFAYDLDKITKAKKIVKLFEEHRSKGITGFIHIKYGFIDEPIYKDALNILGQ